MSNGSGRNVPGDIFIGHKHTFDNVDTGVTSLCFSSLMPSSTWEHSPGYAFHSKLVGCFEQENRSVVEKIIAILGKDRFHVEKYGDGIIVTCYTHEDYEKFWHKYLPNVTA